MSLLQANQGPAGADARDPLPHSLGSAGPGRLFQARNTGAGVPAPISSFDAPVRRLCLAAGQPAPLDSSSTCAAPVSCAPLRSADEREEGSRAMSGLNASAPSFSLRRLRALAPSLLGVALGLGAVACGSDEAAGEEAARVGFDDATLEELQGVGVDRYVGMFDPEEVRDYGDGLFGFHFAADENGPICLWGDPYSFGLQDTGSEDLLIYLQGGGACWSELCSANVKAGDRVPTLGWTDPSSEQNPFHGYNMAHVAYCDGSVFSGDNEIDRKSVV